jgi:hypothetical protein
MRSTTMRAFAGLLLLTGLAESASAQQGAASFGLQVSSETTLPSGPSTHVYETGSGARASIVASLRAQPWLVPSLDVGFQKIPLEATSAGLDAARAGLGARVSVPLFGRLRTGARVSFGFFRGVLKGRDPSWGYDVYTDAGAGLSLLLSSRFALDADLGYTIYRDVYRGATISVGATQRLAGWGGGPIPTRDVAPIIPNRLPARGMIRISGAETAVVFPALLKYYGGHPVGRVTITNAAEGDVEDVQVRLEAPPYIETPVISANIGHLGPRESRIVDLSAVFGDALLGVTEGTRAAALVAVDYTIAGRQGRDTAPVVMEIRDRNALTWDDDRKIGAFVTSRDDEVQSLAKAAAGLPLKTRGGCLPGNLAKAVAVYAALKEMGVVYVDDPTSSYRQGGATTERSVDYVQFPRQTLYRRGGDCDDLATTYCALLESVGVPSAFITVPGHIYPAFGLGVSIDEAGTVFATTDGLLVRPDGTVWVPVDVTALKGGFLQAWSAGVALWSDASLSGQAAFFTTADAWCEFPPVGPAMPGMRVATPATDALGRAVAAEMAAIAKRAIADREGALLREIARTQGGPAAYNRLGVLYALYGLAESAGGQFRAALGRGPFVSALVNLGSLKYLEANLEEARDYYRRALALRADDAIALLGMARIARDASDHGTAREYYDRLKAVDPALAGRHSYLGRPGAQAGRASESTDPFVFWEAP